MNRILSRLFAFLTFGGLTGSAFADSYGFANTDAIVNKTDISINLLSQLFGTVGSALQGSSGQMFGQLLYQVNNAFILIVGLWLAFSIVMMVMRSAGEGSFMSQNKNIGFAFLKVCAGVSLLIPNPTTGYSVMQSIVGEIVVQSVGFADSTWNYALNYLTNGGQIYVSNDTQGGDPTISDDQVKAVLSPQSGSNTLLGTILSAQVCQLSSQYSMQDSSTGSATSTSYSMLVDNTGFRVLFPGYGDTSTNPDDYMNSTPKCGAISWNIKNACQNVTADQIAGATDADDNKQTAQCAMARDAILNAITVIQPVAREYYCSRHMNNTDYCTGVDTTKVTSDSINYLSMALIDYYNLIQTLATSQTTTNKTSIFADNAKTAGWISAGRYYWDLSASVTDGGSRPNNLEEYVPDSTDIKTYDVTQAGNLPFSDAQAALFDAGNEYGGDHNVCSSLPNGSVTCLVDQYNKTQASVARSGNANAQSATGGDGTYHAVHCGAGDWGSSLPSFMAPLKDALNTMGSLGTAFCKPFADASNNIGSWMQGAANTTNDAVHSGENSAKNAAYGSMYNIFANINLNPLVFLTNLGKTCLTFGVNLWVLPLVLIITLGTVASICSGGKYIATPLRWLQGFFSTVAITLCSVGLMLTLYVPLYPYMLFTFGVIHWFIAVIEAMVAAPLICFGLTHPEGHDLLGKAQQSLMFFLGLFLRPVLMVVGMFCGIIVSYVGMELLVFTFTGLMTDLLTNTPVDSVTGNGQVWQSASHFMNNANIHGAIQKFFIQFFVVTPGILVVFCMLVYTVLTKSFGLIYELPDRIMSWIGVHTPGSSVEQLTGQMKGVIGSVGRTGGKAGTQVGSVGGDLGVASVNKTDEMSAKYWSGK